MIYLQGNEHKATDKALDSYWHIKEYLQENYDTLTDTELNNMIHNLEQIIPMVENPELQLLAGFDQGNYDSRMNYKLENGIYLKL